MILTIKYAINVIIIKINLIDTENVFEALEFKSFYYLIASESKIYYSSCSYCYCNYNLSIFLWVGKDEGKGY